MKLKQKPKITGLNTKLIAVMLSVFIIALLILSPPARAFNLDLNSDKTNIFRGENVVFNLSIDINFNEKLPIDKIIFQLKKSDGKKNVSCEFYVNGTIISGCNGMTIKKISSADFGYGYYSYGYNNGNYNSYGYDYGYDFGYGYGYNGKLQYKITLDSSNYETGTYLTKIIAVINGKNGKEEFSETGKNLTIKNADNANNNIMSIRGNYGETCETEWQCTGWKECINGKKTRICSKINSYCDVMVNKPLEITGCSDSSEGVINLSKNNKNNSNINESFNTEGINRGFAGITGAAIGVVGETGFWIIVVFISVLIGLFFSLILIRAIRKRRRLNAY